MAQLGKVQEVQGRSALTDAAERLDRIARVVKDQQLADTHSGPRIAMKDTYTASPEEMWAKKFMTQAIGPAAISLEPPMAPFCSPIMATQGLCSVPAAKSAAPAAPTPEIRPGASARPIGGSIGKPQRKRSGLARFFLGR